MAEEKPVEWQRWSVVYAGGKPGEVGARLIGTTLEKIPHQCRNPAHDHVARARRRRREFRMHGQMAAYPHRHDDGRLYWAWHLEREEDLPFVLDCRPLVN